MAQARVTTDHEAIRHWTEARGGHPATVKRTERGHEPGVLRLDFDPPEEALEEITWEDFFDKFDEAGLAFLYQDRTASGKTSRFHKFVDRSSADQEDETEDDEE
ncbi:MAG TPA: hypothetical protein VGL35_15005 [Rhizomicrobium sp.]|jgi:hypothetical protein